jgi:hypothetical protein
VVDDRRRLDTVTRPQDRARGALVTPIPLFYERCACLAFLMALSCNLVLSNLVDCPCPHPHPTSLRLCALTATTTLLWFLCLALANTPVSSLHHSNHLDIILAKDMHTLGFYTTA